MSMPDRGNLPLTFPKRVFKVNHTRTLVLPTDEISARHQSVYLPDLARVALRDLNADSRDLPKEVTMGDESRLPQ